MHMVPFRSESECIYSKGHDSLKSFLMTQAFLNPAVSRFSLGNLSSHFQA